MFKKNSTLNELNNVFNIILDCKNQMFWTMMFSMFYLFSLQILDILDLKVLDLGYFQNWLFWSVELFQLPPWWDRNSYLLCLTLIMY